MYNWKIYNFLYNNESFITKLSMNVCSTFLQQLCDVILEVNGEKINAHRVVLASVSPYFYAMFNGTYRYCIAPLIKNLTPNQRVSTSYLLLTHITHAPCKFKHKQITFGVRICVCVCMCEC